MNWTQLEDGIYRTTEEFEYKPNTYSEIEYSVITECYFGEDSEVWNLPVGDYIGDYIDEDETRQLLDKHEQERVVLCLYTGMSTGKSTYSLDVFGGVALERNMRVLYVSPRRVLREQHENDYYKYHPIEERLFKARADFTCYQPLLEQLSSKSGLERLKNDYDAIVFDEFHQPFSDSSFIEEVEPLMKWIYETNQFMIILTATYDIPMEYLRLVQAKKYIIQQEIDFSNPTVEFVLGTEQAIIDFLSQNKDKSGFICQRKLFKNGYPTPIVKYCLDNREEMDLSTKVSDNFFSKSKWNKIGDYDEESVKTIKQLNKNPVNKLMPSRTLLASSVFSTGTELFGYVDENGETVNKIDYIVVNFIDVDELKQAIRRVRVFHDVTVLIQCHDGQAISGALQTLKNEYSDQVINYFEEYYRDGTRKKLDNWLTINNNRTSLPNGLYVEIGTGEVKLNFTEVSNVYYKRQQLETIQAMSQNVKYKNSSEAYKQYIIHHLITCCNCNKNQFRFIYSEYDIIDDSVQVNEYLTELYNNEELIPCYSKNGKSYNKNGDYVGVFIAFTNEEKKQFAKNIGSVTDKDKNPSGTPSTVNKTLEQYGLNDKWEVKSIEDKKNKKTGLVLIKKQQDVTNEEVE